MGLGSKHQSALYRAIEERATEVIKKRLLEAFPHAKTLQVSNIVHLTWPDGTQSVALYVGTRRLMADETRLVDGLKAEQIPYKIFRRVDEDLY